jgi:hypothetical protein
MICILVFVRDFVVSYRNINGAGLYKIITNVSVIAGRHDAESQQNAAGIIVRPRSAGKYSRKRATKQHKGQYNRCS